jgi:transmembrane sensor
MLPTRIQYLVDQYFDGACTVKEKEELAAWISRSSDDEDVRISLEQAWEKHKPALLMPDEISERIIGSLFGPEKELTGISIIQWPAARTVGPSRWRWWAAATVLILISGVSGYRFLFDKPTKPKMTALRHDVAPGRSAAILTIGGGKRIVLDSNTIGTVSMQGNMPVVNAHGQLAYNLSKEKPTETLYNTLTTLRGNQYKLILSDGTKVWLNASSSLRFPTRFNGKCREVVLEGEAYFEVAKNGEMPFHVQVNDMEVEVLGTHFNINAYSDESTVKTTLLEGLVRIHHGKCSPVLKPGEQAKLERNGDIRLIKNDPDIIDDAIAWHNGYFSFDKVDIKAVMRQLSKWYNVTVQYEGPLSKTEFGGKIERDLTLMEVLKILEKSKVHFRLEGNLLTVLP